MKEQWLGIVIIALAVVIIGAAIIYGRSLVRTGREKVEDEERKAMFNDIWDISERRCRCALYPVDEDDDSTKTLSILPGDEP